MTINIHATDVSYEVQAASILHRVQLDVGHGEFLGLIGPNGAGKSTLLRTLAGVLLPTDGRVSVAGVSTTRLTPRELARLVAAVPQDTGLDFTFTVREVVLMGRHAHLGRFGIEGEHDSQVAVDALSRTGCLGLIDRPITSLSGGQRQLVFIAKALAQQPKVLLLDEPISSLDIRNQLEILELVQQLCAEGLIAIAALHDLNLAARFCSRLALISDGRLVGDGTPTEVLTPEAVRAAYGVRVSTHPDPDTGALTVTALSVDRPEKAAAAQFHIQH